MELSKMFGVERGKKFQIDGYKGLEFSVNNNFNRKDKLYFRDPANHWWDVATPEMLFNIIDAAPSGIIHLPPPLTDEQRVVLMSLFTMGARYMGMTQEGWKRCFVNKPEKEFSGWTCGDTQVLTIANGMANCLDSLVSWSDPEPYDIAKALGVEG